jgi:hypothetical protein
MGEKLEAGPLLYAAFKSREAFENALEEYKIYMKNQQKSSDQLAVHGAKVFLEEVMKKYDVASMFPESLRPIVKSMMSQPFSYTVDIMSAALKEYAKDKSTGEYRTTQEVFGQVVNDFLKTKVLEKIFET